MDAFRCAYLSLACQLSPQVLYFGFVFFYMYSVCINMLLSANHGFEHFVGYFEDFFLLLPVVGNNS